MLGPLLDRIEIISIPAYLPIEKINIAKQYLVPGFEEEYAFEAAEDEHIQITDASIVQMITHYCYHEAGVRNLRKCIDRIFRKIVAKIEEHKVEDGEEEQPEESEAVEEECATPAAAEETQPTLY